MIKQLDQLLRMHDDGVLDRRQLLGALLAAFAAPGHPSTAYRTSSPLRRGRTLNHVTLSVADISIGHLQACCPVRNQSWVRSRRG
jgi:hypothetical protein